MSRILDREDLDAFVETGVCTLKGSFSSRQAEAATECLWRRMEEKAGIRRDRPSSWPPSYDIEEHLRDAPVLECFSDRLAGAIEDLVGRDRWSQRRQWGLWPVNFSFGADVRDAIPSRGWHVDGNWFRHTIDCPKQGLLVIGLFTDIEPGWGGTILSLGSHKRTAHVLARHPEGMSHLELFEEALSAPLGDFYEVTGEAGDVVLAHPFLFHTRGYKRGGPPRIVSNTEAPLLEPMRLDRPRADELSVLEHSIVHALSEEIPVPDRGQLCRF